MQRQRQLFRQGDMDGVGSVVATGIRQGDSHIHRIGHRSTGGHRLLNVHIRRCRAVIHCQCAGNRHKIGHQKVAVRRRQQRVRYRSRQVRTGGIFNNNVLGDGVGIAAEVGDGVGSHHRGIASVSCQFSIAHSHIVVQIAVGDGQTSGLQPSDGQVSRQLVSTVGQTVNGSVGQRACDGRAGGVAHRYQLVNRHSCIVTVICKCIDTGISPFATFPIIRSILLNNRELQMFIPTIFHIKIRQSQTREGI